MSYLHAAGRVLTQFTELVKTLSKIENDDRTRENAYPISKEEKEKFKKELRNRLKDHGLARKIPLRNELDLKRINELKQLHFKIKW